MWRALMETPSLEEAAGRLEALYAVDEGVLMPDLRAFVENLLGRGLLEKMP